MEPESEPSPEPKPSAEKTGPVPLNSAGSANMHDKPPVMSFKPLRSLFFDDFAIILFFTISIGTGSNKICDSDYNTLDT